jgi:asparagine synthase (glutamine-hydrolysing)
MCGIIAVYDARGGDTAECVARGMATLRHRGPDAQHFWQSADHEICLGHTRLSIIDLAGGDQPIANEDESIHVVVNGEFYDFERIRADLEARGHRFRTHSDSEILLHLYEDHGVECVHYLRGEYAFVLWDARRRRLFAARDRFGIKPLFYAQRGGRLLLASEAKALFAAGVPAAWDALGYAEMFAFAASAPRTVFAGVSSLPPGHYLLADGTDVATRKYWDFDYPLEATLPAGRSGEEYAEEFGAMLDAAVQTRLRADVPVGCYLSGGIDSCSVLALMARHAPGRVRAFSLSFDHSMYDEGPIAREMAERTGAEFTMIPMSHAAIADNLSDAIWHGETLFINGNSAAKFALSRAVRDAGFKVVLTGEGSDEVLAGYPFFRMDLIRHNGIAAAAGGAPANPAEALIAGNTSVMGLMLAGAPVAPIGAFVERLGYFPSVFEARKAGFDQMRAALDFPIPPDEVFVSLLDRLDVAGQMDGRHPLNQSLYLNNKTVLPSYILTVLGDRMEMAHSIEGRVPFLDHQLVEYSRKLPVSQKINGTTEKYVLRESMKPLLTDRVYRRQKHPFLSPPALLKPEEPLHALLQDTLRGKALDRVPFLRRQGVHQVLDRAATLDDAGKIAMEIPLMLMLSGCILAERFGL